MTISEIVSVFSLLVAVGGFVGTFFSMRAEVAFLKEQIKEKANKDTVVDLKEDIARLEGKIDALIAKGGAR